MDAFLPVSIMKNLHWHQFHACLAGALLSLNDRGRLIGLLERLVIFFLVLHQQYTALGFVLTAKSIARFKELENRDFAEYFLIGTLLSIVIAGSIALVTQALLL